MTRQEIIDVARKLLGTRFHHQGRLPGGGLDCIGVVCSVFRAFGLEYRDQIYRRRPDAETLLGALNEHCPALPTVELAQVGDIGAFWTKRRELVVHCGILAPEGRLIHAWANTRRVVETTMGAYWEERLIAAYEIPGVEGTWPR